MSLRTSRANLHDVESHRRFIVIAVALIVTAATARAQPRPAPVKPAETIASVMDAQLGLLESQLVPAAEAMPEANYAFVPEHNGFDGSRTFALQVKHIATSNIIFFSAIVLILGGIGMASTLSAWYHRIYERTPPKGFLRHLAYQGAGVIAFTLYISFEVWLFGKVRPFGGYVTIFLLTFVLAVLFWWWSAYMLLYRQVPLRQMLPAGVATAR